MIQIAGGLTPSDRIVSSPPDYVVNGMPATIQSQASSSASGAAGGQAK
jgi:hypothetical protein